MKERGVANLTPSWKQKFSDDKDRWAVACGTDGRLKDRRLVDQGSIPASGCWCWGEEKWVHDSLRRECG